MRNPLLVTKRNKALTFISWGFVISQKISILVTYKSMRKIILYL